MARPEQAPVDLNRIHNNLHTVGLCPTFAVSFGLGARMTAQALQRIFDIPISHQTVINYINASARYLSGFVDANSPVPKGTSAADETCIKIEGLTHYTWFIIEQYRRAVCGFVAFYNFMRPHGRIQCHPPVPLTCLQGERLYPKMWVELLRQAA